MVLEDGFGNADPREFRRALSAQAFTVLAKPVSRSMAIYIVRRALAKFY